MMAVTKIWPIKDSLRRVVDYARNPAKTEFTDLQAVLHYAANGEKTEHGAEKTMYVTGINCSRDRAFQEMYAVQERFAGALRKDRRECGLPRLPELQAR